MPSSRTDQPGWLALTKLQPPLLRDDLVQRPSLVEAFRVAVLSSRLTLVSAPAGYGKSTLLGYLSQKNTGVPVGWLSIDEDDSDTTRFFTAVVMAMRCACPGYGASTLSLLGAGSTPVPNPNEIAAVLVNDTLKTVTEPTVLVLDDFHLIAEKAVFAALGFFLERMPAPLHWQSPPATTRRSHWPGFALGVSSASFGWRTCASL